MVLATSELKAYINQNHIENLIDRHAIKGSSIDLRINNTVNILNQDITPMSIDFTDDKIDSVIEGLYKKVELSNKDFYLAPNSYLYGSTYEKITVPQDKCAILLARSTFARLGLILPISQYANPGYEGNLPIIIYNSTIHKIKIPP